MSEKIKDKIVTIAFLSIIIGFFVINLFAKDSEISSSERRKLKQFPTLSMKSVLDTSFSDELEDYAMDQFILRDKFRSIKTFFKLNVLHQKENNDLFIVGDKIYKTLYPLDEKSILNFDNKINNIYNKYLSENNNVYYTIVPDKNYYLDESINYLKLDYDMLISKTKENINSNIKYIDILDTLNINSYYMTDAHWKQENIIDTAQKIAKEMKMTDRINFTFETKEYGKFYGSYYGQLGKAKDTDTIVYLTNDIIENATTFNYETQKEKKIYDIQKADDSMDKYDIFLSGATPIIEIRNDKSEQNRELIVFRDSFGSSITPLFTEAYSKIILVDTRYVTTDLISNYIEFNENQDVLFIYSTLLINDSDVLK